MADHENTGRNLQNARESPQDRQESCSKRNRGRWSGLCLKRRLRESEEYQGGFVMIETMVHQLKTWPEYYKEVVNGNKTFEVRKNDRDFKVGDYLALKEFDPDNGFTKEMCIVRVTYILDKQPFVPEGYVVMGFKMLKECL